MDVPSRHRWLVYYKLEDELWALYSEHLMEWEAETWAEAHLASGTTYRIVEVLWTPEIESIREMTKG